MDENLQKIFNALRRFWAILMVNKLATALLLIIFLVLVPLIYQKIMTQSTFVNKEAGFEITCPSGWEVVPAKDKLSVTCRKPSSRPQDETVIKMEMNFGNPYGVNALEYIENGLVPQVLYTYEEQKQSSVSFRDHPYQAQRKKILWARTSFLIDMNELQILNVTQTGDRVFVLLMRSRGTHQKEDEQALTRVLDSVVIRDPDTKDFLY